MQITKKGVRMKGYDRAVSELTKVISLQHQSVKVRHDSMSIEEYDRERLTIILLEKLQDMLEVESIKGCVDQLRFMTPEATALVPESVWYYSRQ